MENFEKKAEGSLFPPRIFLKLKKRYRKKSQIDKKKYLVKKMQLNQKKGIIM